MSGRNSLPDSLDLLLDTMCNTFGSVMFISISLVLLLSLCQKAFQTKSPEELDREFIEKTLASAAAMDEECLDLEKRIVRAQESAKLSVQEKALLAEIQKMEEKLRSYSYEKVLLEDALKISSEKWRSLKNENDRTEEVCLETRKKLQEEEARIHRRLEQETQKVADARKTMESIQEKQLVFARNERTDKTPLWMIFKGNRIYRVHSNELMRAAARGKNWEGNREIGVKWRGLWVLLTPKEGMPFSSVSAPAAMASYMQSVCSSRKDFCSIFVSPESFETFVALRRCLRECRYQVDWSIADTYWLFFSDHVEHSASD